jgi:hypothetical protein
MALETRSIRALSVLKSGKPWDKLSALCFFANPLITVKIEVGSWGNLEVNPDIEEAMSFGICYKCSKFDRHKISIAKRLVLSAQQRWLRNAEEFLSLLRWR